MPIKEKRGFKNFKAFGSTMQYFSQKPITLVYGTNSAGKSSILHSFLYLKYISHFQGLDLKQTYLFGDKLDLGGFRNTVFKKNTNKSIQYSFIIEDIKFIRNLFKKLSFDNTFYEKISNLKLDIVLSKKGIKVDVIQKLFIDDIELYQKVNSKITINRDFEKDIEKIEYLSFLLKFKTEGFNTQYIGPLRFYPNRNELKFSSISLFIDNMIRKIITFWKPTYQTMSNTEFRFSEIKRWKRKTSYIQTILNLDKFPFLLKPIVFFLRAILYPFVCPLASISIKMELLGEYIKVTYYRTHVGLLWRAIVSPTIASSPNFKDSKYI